VAGCQKKHTLIELATLKENKRIKNTQTTQLHINYIKEKNKAKQSN